MKEINKGLEKENREFLYCSNTMSFMTGRLIKGYTSDLLPI